MGKIRQKRIRWEPSFSPDVVKYRLYWSQDGLVNYHSKYVDVGYLTEIFLPEGVPSFPSIRGTINLGISAVNEAGNESDITNVTAELDFVLPDPPKRLWVEEVLDAPKSLQVEDVL